MKTLIQITIMLCLLLVLGPAYSALPLPGSSSDAFNRGQEASSTMMNRILQQRLELQKLEHQQNKIPQDVLRELNDDKLFSLIKSAQLGDPDSAISVGNIFNERSNYDHDKNNLISAFAWFQVAWMIGQKTHILKNGDIVAMPAFLDDCRKQSVLNKKDLKKADEMALRICSNIPKCAQNSKHEG